MACASPPADLRPQGIWLAGILLSFGGLSCSDAESPSPDLPEEADIARLQQLGYVDYMEVEDGSRPSGGVIHDAQSMQKGMNLLSIHKLCSARLVDAEGSILHEWSRPGKVWGHADLQQDGSILVPTVEEDGSFLVKLDWRNRLVWRLPFAAHHDVEVLPDGRIATLTFRWREMPQISKDAEVRDEHLLLLDAEGNRLAEYSLTEMLDAAPEWEFLEVEPAKVKGGRDRIDLLHANSVVWMRPGWVEWNPLFAEGNVLISMRHQNRVALLRPETGELLWSWGLGEMLGQHDATVLPNGHVLIFDNGLGRGWSQVLEVDPTTDAIVWQWQAPQRDGFYTMARGAAQRLENGNTLLVDSDHGHAFEITAAGEVVWEYYQPGSGDRVPAIVRMKRFPLDYLGSLLDG
ncbi:MAG: arylsulfotransferase family protein [Planctomycetota bacterium]